MQLLSHKSKRFTKTSAVVDGIEASINTDGCKGHDRSLTSPTYCVAVVCSHQPWQQHQFGRLHVWRVIVPEEAARGLYLTGGVRPAVQKRRQAPA